MSDDKPFWPGLLDRLRGIRKPWLRGREPLEIRRAILEEIEGEVVAVGPGERLFPYDRVDVYLAADDERERAVLEAAIEHGWRLEEAMTELLAELGCAHGPVAVGYHFVAGDDPALGDRRFGLAYGRGSERVAVAGRPALELTVVKGTAERQSYRFEQDRVLIGRLAEVVDAHGRVQRNNHVAFLEEGDGSDSVSREHARILYRDDPASRAGAYWLIDDRSAFGTRIFRDGRAIDVSSRDRRGIRLASGDTIYLGRAALEVTIGAASSGRAAG